MGTYSVSQLGGCPRNVGSSLESGRGSQTSFCLLFWTHEITCLSCRSAVLLQQVCDYYNSLNEEILEFHKPLLLGDAVEFERAVRRGCAQTPLCDGKSTAGHHPRVTWGDIRTLEEFAVEVEEKFLKLQRKNKQLQRDHGKVSVLKLLFVCPLQQAMAEWLLVSRVLHPRFKWLSRYLLVRGASLSLGHRQTKISSGSGSGGSLLSCKHGPSASLVASALHSSCGSLRVRACEAGPPVILETGGSECEQTAEGRGNMPPHLRTGAQ